MASGSGGGSQILNGTKSDRLSENNLKMYSAPYGPVGGKMRVSECVGGSVGG